MNFYEPCYQTNHHNQKKEYKICWKCQLIKESANNDDGGPNWICFKPSLHIELRHAAPPTTTYWIGSHNKKLSSSRPAGRVVYVCWLCLIRKSVNLGVVVLYVTVNQTNAYMLRKRL